MVLVLRRVSSRRFFQLVGHISADPGNCLFRRPSASVTQPYPLMYAYHSTDLVLIFCVVAEGCASLSIDGASLFRGAELQSAGDDTTLVGV